MAKTTSPLSSGNAAASVGVALNWFEDVAGPRARARPRPRPSRTERQAQIRTVNQVVWDRFPTLPAEQRTAWAAYARQAPARRGRLFFIHPAQHVYTATNIIPYDQRGSIYDDPPWSDPIISPLSVEIERLPGSGILQVRVDWPTGTDPLCLVDIWACHRWSPPAPRSVRPPWRHVSYVAAGSPGADLDLDPNPHYLIGWRAVSVRGRTWRTWRTWRD